MRCICGSVVARIAICVFFAFRGSYVFATGYGVFDPRSMGMGGAAVAAGNAEQAHAYNSALLSFYDESENSSRNGRIIHPYVSAQVSDGGKAVANIVADELDERLTDAVSLYNANPADLDIAQSLLDSLVELETALDQLNQEVIELDVYTGIVISEPSEREGGSFYFHLRGMVFGEADISDADLSLLSNQIDLINDVISGTPGAPINNPVPNLTSTAAVTSLLIAEWGLAIAKEFPIFGQPISFGVTPKIMQVEVYSENLNFIDPIPSYSESSKRHLFMNADVGIAAELFDNYRAGLSVRNILTKTLEDENSVAVAFNPRARLGLAYINDFLTVGLDFDLEKNQPIASEPESQEIALGVEFHPWETMKLRLGYMQDSAGERDDVLSAGVRYQIWRLGLEAAFVVSGDITGGSVLAGWAF